MLGWRASQTRYSLCGWRSCQRGDTMQLCVTVSQPGSSENGELISKACLDSSNRISGGRRKRVSCASQSESSHSVGVPRSISGSDKRCGRRAGQRWTRGRRVPRLAVVQSNRWSRRLGPVRVALLRRKRGNRGTGLLRARALGPARG
jgi:hypothetical protein